MRVGNIESHSKSKNHKRCAEAVKAAEAAARGQVTEIRRIVDRMEEGLKLQMVNAFQVAYYIAQKERPYTDFPDLLGLCKKTGGSIHDSAYHSDKACAA